MNAQICREKLLRLRAELDKVVVGYDQEKTTIILVLLSGGNVLLRAVPGTAKTTLIVALQKAIENCQASRIQLTPDIKPSDIIGSKIWDPASKQFVTVWGPAVEKDHEPVNIVHADEFNRATGKTLSAFLQPAQEKAVTIGDETRQMEELYMLSATINPIEQEGTYEIPEAMIDRFDVLVDLGYVSRSEEIQMLGNILKNKRKSLNLVKKVISKEDILQMREYVDDIAAQMSQPAKEYIVDLVRATRPDDDRFEAVHGKADAERLKKMIKYGGSPRAIIATAYLAAAHALFEGSDKVSVDDIKAVAGNVLHHRVFLQPAAARKTDVAKDIVQPLFGKVPLLDGRLSRK